MREWSYPSRSEEPGVERSGPSTAPRRAPGGAGVEVRGYREATLLVADVVNLPGLASAAGADRLVAILDQIFRAADRSAAKRGLSRVAVAGGFYGAVAGVPTPRLDHAEAAAEMATDLLRAAAAIATPGDKGLAVRVGLHSGPVVAALEGGDTVRELWGESARVAARMASQGVPGLVQVSGAAAARLAARYRLEVRPGSPGLPGLQGARPLDAWFLMGRRGN